MKTGSLWIVALLSIIGLFLNSCSMPKVGNKDYIAATFPGGEDALYDFIAQHKKYQQDAVNAGVEGSVQLKAIVSKEGALQKIRVIQAVYPSVDQEAIRIIKAMPQWIPARYKGKMVSSEVNLKVDFYFLR
ncbi:MAG TPA: energy transducer TonB [Edaphocola sp.]|nr:energy transducer TonB [Edaphocola sp.]